VDRRKILLVVAVVVAALGATLVFVYAQGAEDRAKDDIATVPVLVAQQVIAPGESASDAANAGKLVSKNIPSDQVLTGATNDGKMFADAVAKTTIYPGEQLVTQKFGTVEEIEADAQLPIPDGLVGYPINLDDLSRVSGFTRPGSRVGAIITGTFPPDTEVSSRLLLDDVSIFATGAQTITKTTGAPTVDASGQPVEAPITAPVNQYVIAVKPRETLRLDLAQTFGKIQLILLPPDSKLKVGDVLTAADLFSTKTS
jgi:pilus assembly protein CpaB